MSVEWNIKKYCKLQEKRRAGKIDKEERKELEAMAMHRLFSMIDCDPDVKAAFDKLKDK